MCNLDIVSFIKKLQYKLFQLLNYIICFYTSRNWIYIRLFNHLKTKIIPLKSYEELIKDIEAKYSEYNIVNVPYALGETTMTCQLSNELKKRNNGKILMLVKDDAVYDYVKHFDCVDEVKKMSVDFTRCVQNRENMSEKTELGVLFNPLKGYKNPKNIYKEIDCFFTWFLSLFQVEGDYDVSHLIFDKDIEQKMIKKYKITDKTVIVSPGANALNNKILDKDFWINMIEKLTAEGYHVLINVLDKIYGDKYSYIDENVYNTILIAKNCKCIVGFRSGLMDAFAANTDTNMYIFYPTTDFQMYKSCSNEEMKKHFSVITDEDFEKVVNDGQSLVKMFNKKNIYEKRIKLKDMDNLINETLEYLKSIN